jgi:hypothetical protein
MDRFQSLMAYTYGDDAAQRLRESLSEMFENVESLQRESLQRGRIDLDDAPTAAELVEEFYAAVPEADPNQLELLPLDDGHTPKQFNQMRRDAASALEYAVDAEREAWELAVAINNETHYDPTQVELNARETIEELGIEPRRGNTEYAMYQRVDKNAPYREIVIRDPEVGSGVARGHFDRALTHARAEIHDDTFLLIEVQSDLGAKDLDHLAEWKPLGRRVQLSVGAALYRAAEEGMNAFQWVDAGDRVRRASLSRNMAELIYEQEVPKAVERIFKQLGESDLPPLKQTHGIRLTRAMRQRILEMGVPALGIAGLSALKPSELPQRKTEKEKTRSRR